MGTAATPIRDGADLLNPAVVKVVWDASYRALYFSRSAIPHVRDAAPGTVAEGLHWRHIGPHRGGRVTAVAGHRRQPGTFYMGATGGGVWKSTDYGQSWANVSDGFFETASIGAIDVAESNPDVIYVGTGRAAERGLLVRGGEALEALARVDTVVFDKTGTLTEGKPAVTAIVGDDPDALLRLAASVERDSEHPLATAIVAAAEARGQTPMRRVHTLVIRPSEDLGKLAQKNLKSGVLRGGPALRAILGLLDVGASSDADLASYLLFDGAFARRLIELGRADAEQKRTEIDRFFESAESDPA
jgi:hypothetical protein